MKENEEINFVYDRWNLKNHKWISDKEMKKIRDGLRNQLEKKEILFLNNR